jgi:hypothetical protein
MTSLAGVPVFGNSSPGFETAIRTADPGVTCVVCSPRLFFSNLVLSSVFQLFKDGHPQQNNSLEEPTVTTRWLFQALQLLQSMGVSLGEIS